MNQGNIRSLMEGGVVTLIGLAIFLLIPSQVEKPLAGETQIPPSFLPMVVGIALMATGGAIMVQTLARLGPPATQKLIREEWRRMGLSAGLLFLYGYFFSRLGFVVSSALILGFFTLLFGSRSWVKIGLSMALVPLGVWLFFEVLFAIPLPRGLLF